MRKFWALAGALFLISGCLGKLEDMTEKTHDAVVNSNNIIEATHRGQTLATALNIWDNPKSGTNLRTAAGETIIVLADDEKIFRFIGAPIPLKYYNFEDTFFSPPIIGPNVAYVGLKSQPLRGVYPVPPETHAILMGSCTSGLNFLKKQSVQKDADLEVIKEKGRKALLVCPAIYGGVAQFDDANDPLHNSWITSEQQDELKALRARGNDLLARLASLPLFDATNKGKYLGQFAALPFFNAETKKKVNALAGDTKVTEGSDMIQQLSGFLEQDLLAKARGIVSDRKAELKDIQARGEDYVRQLLGTNLFPEIYDKVINLLEVKIHGSYANIPQEVEVE